jgi:hypothetical protein
MEGEGIIIIILFTLIEDDSIERVHFSGGLVRE